MGAACERPSGVQTLCAVHHEIALYFRLKKCEDESCNFQCALPQLQRMTCASTNADLYYMSPFLDGWCSLMRFLTCSNVRAAGNLWVGLQTS